VLSVPSQKAQGKAQNQMIASQVGVVRGFSDFWGGMKPPLFI